MLRQRVSRVRVLGYTGWAIVGLTGLELGLRIAADMAGIWGVVAASVLFPATIAAAPLLALTWGQWLPALVVYGGGLTAGMLIARTDRVDDGSVPTSATS